MSDTIHSGILTTGAFSGLIQGHLGHVKMRCPRRSDNDPLNSGFLVKKWSFRAIGKFNSEWEPNQRPMRITTMKLTDINIKKAKPGEKARKMFDGGGLYIQIEPTGGKLWRYKYRFDGKEKKLTLGKYPDVSLAGGAEAAQ